MTGELNGKVAFDRETIQHALPISNRHCPLLRNFVNRQVEHFHGRFIILISK